MVPPELTCADMGSIAPVILHRKLYLDIQQGGSIEMTVIVSNPQLQQGRFLEMTVMMSNPQLRARWYGTAQF